MEEIRVMWCDVLEELLQCPVCLEISLGVKIQCVNGHHICNTCRVHLGICPICKAHFIGTRNLAVEQLSAKLEEIKLSLLSPYHALNRRILRNKVCVATQTENIGVASTSSQTEDTKQLIPNLNHVDVTQICLAPRVGKGPYPCRIQSCNFELPHGRMIGHLRHFHRNVYYEFAAIGNLLRKQWSIEFMRNQRYDYAFHVKGMGLFFLNIIINNMSDLTLSLQIVNCTAVCKQFSYTIETSRGYVLYNGQVRSCRGLHAFSKDYCMRIPGNNVRQFLTYVDNKNYFYCNLIIKRKVDHEPVNEQNPMGTWTNVVNNVKDENDVTVESNIKIEKI